MATQEGGGGGAHGWGGALAEPGPSSPACGGHSANNEELAKGLRVEGLGK